ncbi:MAG: terminase family protein [Acidobacteriota bacterium]|nr:terminase family protein [Acidobacteriota bacterium]
MQLARELSQLRVRAERLMPSTSSVLDPITLAAYAGFTLDPSQRDVLLSDAHQLIILASRQSGKSTVSSIRALHRALYTPSSLVLLLAPSFRQSKELFRKVKDALASLPFAVPAASESALELEFSNGSRIISLPGKESTIRGFSGVSLLVVDEASRVPDELYQAIRPMLAVSGGDIVLLSTPFGKRGFFHHEWSEGGAGWHRTKVTAYDCPRIPRAWLEEERQQIGDFWFEQEYLVEFKDDVSAVFRYEDIQDAMTNTIEPQWSIADALR